MTRTLALSIIALAATLAAGQGSEPRGSMPLGTARDGSRPAEGAIIGGSLEPDIRLSPAPKRDIQRCRQLAAQLREDCLRTLGADPARKGEARPRATARQSG